MDIPDSPISDSSLRHVLTPEARALYLDIVDKGGVLLQSAEEAPGRAIRQLLDIGLLIPRHRTEGPGYVVVDPHYVEARWGMALHAQAAELLHHAAELPRQLDELFEAYARIPTATPQSDMVQYVHGYPRINGLIAEILAGCTTELLTVQPGGPRQARSLDLARRRDLDVLHRGARMRTLYHSSTRYHAPTRAYAVALAAAGDYQVRTLDEPFARTLIVDGRIAIVPGGPDTSVAAVIQDPAMVRYVIGVFERDWQRADPFVTAGATSTRLTSKLHTAIIRLLKEGLSQAAVAKRLGMSQRTVAGHLAQIREEFGVDTLFQLGVEVARLERKQADGEGRGPE